MKLFILLFMLPFAIQAQEDSIRNDSIEINEKPPREDSVSPIIQQARHSGCKQDSLLLLQEEVNEYHIRCFHDKIRKGINRYINTAALAAYAEDSNNSRIRVFLSFEINESGLIENIKGNSRSNQLVIAEVINALNKYQASMQRNQEVFLPALNQEGNPVSVALSIPVLFVLN